MPNRDEILAGAWDVFTESGHLDSFALDSTERETIVQFHAARDVDGADTEFVSRLKEKLMLDQTMSQPTSTSRSMDASSNGRFRTLAGPPVPVETMPSSNRRSMLIQVAAAVLLLGVGLGYVLRGSVWSDSRGTHPIPAAISTTDDLSKNPFVGVWRMVDDHNDPLGDGFAVFHADGTYVESGPGTTFVGLWRPTGDRTVEVVDVTGSISPPPSPFKPGTQAYYSTYTMDDTGNKFTGYYSPTLADNSGQVFFAGASFFSTGTRFDWDSIAAMSTPTP